MYNDGYLSYFRTNENKVLMIYLNNSLYVNCTNDLQCPTNAVCFKHPSWSNYSSICGCSIDLPVSGMSCNDRFATTEIAVGVSLVIACLCVAVACFVVTSITLVIWWSIAKISIRSYKNVGALDVTLFLAFLGSVCSVIWLSLLVMPFTNVIENTSKEQVSTMTQNVLWAFFVLTLFFYAACCFNTILVWLRFVLLITNRMKRQDMKKIVLTEKRLQHLEVILKLIYTLLIGVMLYFAITLQLNLLAGVGVVLFALFSILFALMHWMFLQGVHKLVQAAGEKKQAAEGRQYSLVSQMKYVYYSSIALLVTFFYVDVLLIVYLSLGGFDARTPDYLISYPLTQAIYLGLCFTNWWIVLYLFLAVWSTYQSVRLRRGGVEQQKNSFVKSTEEDKSEFAIRQIPGNLTKNALHVT